MEELASTIGLLPNKVTFLGLRDDVALLMKCADMLILSSDEEGSPVVLLEAMAAHLPVVTVPAGDADIIVQDGVTGFVVPVDDTKGIAERMVCLAKSPDLRRELGEAGRRWVERNCSFDTLTDLLVSMYRTLVELDGNDRLLAILPRPFRLPIDTSKDFH